MALVISNLHATNDTQKTELILRDNRHRAACFTTFHKLKSKAECKSKAQALFFYNETNDSCELGQVFGANCKNSISIGQPGVADVDANLLLHYYSDPDSNTLAGTITFNPKRTTWGMIIEPFFKLDMILKGLYLKNNFGVMRVKHDLNMKVCDSVTGAISTEGISIADLLSGKCFIRNLSPATLNKENQQQTLKYAKICGSHARTGLNNIETILGWKFLRKDWCKLGVHVALQSPTGDRPTGEWLWEPRLGTQHWGLGAGADAKFKLWKDGNKSLKLYLDFHYRYQFEDTEKRTLGIKNVLTGTNYSKHILSHYYLLGRLGKYCLFPAANLLTRDVDVKPGSQIDTFAALNFNWGKFVFDLGYNIFWKEEENVSMQGNDCWTNDVYAISTLDYLTCTEDFALNDRAVNTCNIDTCVAQTPSILSHTIFGGIGYIFKNWKNPLMLGIGGSYEFGDDRAAADSYTLWAKAGLAF